MGVYCTVFIVSLKYKTDTHVFSLKVSHAGCVRFRSSAYSEWPWCLAVRAAAKKAWSGLDSLLQEVRCALGFFGGQHGQ
jgi:hypothetical protein